MSDPFKIEGPALISFSGGRTSAYMLYRIIQAHGGVLPKDVRVTFENTGKEMSQTLDFVNECAERWDVDVIWLEFALAEKVKDRWRRVSYETAARNGEPYKALLTIRNMLPNPVARFCTADLKIKVMGAFARSLGWGTDWTNVLGLRADEPSRVAKMRDGGNTGWDNTMPLAAAGVTKRDVQSFWKSQNFDLRLPNINGTTPLGNCDLCFLKSVSTIQSIMRQNPSLATWWIETEAEAEIKAGGLRGARFRQERPSYAAMLDAVQRQQVFDFGDADELIDCFCGDAA